MKKKTNRDPSTKQWLLGTLIEGGRRAVIASLMNGEPAKSQKAISARYAKAILLVTQGPDEPDLRAQSRAKED